MAFSREDKQEIGTIVEAKIEPLRTEVRGMAVRHEQFEHDIRGMFKDIKSYMDDNAGLRDRVDQHDADIAVLQRAVLKPRRH